MQHGAAQPGTQIDQLTFTRFLAAITVLYYHFGQGVFPFQIPWLKQVFLVGNISVSYFYALSGFIMAVVYYREPCQRFNKLQYWQARFARIYPVYAIALLATILLLRPQRDALWKEIFGFCMIQSWIPGYPMTYNCPGWSVSVEWFFYLLFPFLLVSFGKNPLRRLCYAIGLFWFSSNLLHIVATGTLRFKYLTPWHDFFFYLPLMHMNTFLCGMVCGVAFLKHGRWLVARPRLNTALLFISTALIVAVLLSRKAIEQVNSSVELTNGVMAPLFLLLIVSLSCDRTLVSRFMSARPCLLLGDASYSIYILHAPIYLAFQKVTPNLNLGLSKAAAVHLYALVVVVLSLVSYLLVERPARTGLKRLFQADWRRSEGVGETSPISG